MTALPDLPVTLTVSAAGAWCKKVTKSALQDVIERLAVRVPPCECIHQEELQTFADSFGCLLFTYSFHGGISSEMMEADQTKIQMFLHRLSVVHAQVRMTFEIRTDSKKDQLIFRGETGSKVSVMDHSISLDSAAFGQSPFSVQCLLSCPKAHPVLGDTFSCVLTTDAIGEGLCGEMRMATMATLTPCMDQYPNWPTRLSCIQISFSLLKKEGVLFILEIRLYMLVYSPCGMPLIHHRHMTFLQDLATSLSWADLAISEVSCMEAQTIEGSLCSEIKFSVDFCHQNEESGCSSSVHQNSEPEWSHAVEQILTLFIFTQYTDAFHSQVSDFIISEEALESHLDSVLWYNGDQVRADLQTTLRSTLKGFQKRQNARQRLQSTLTTVLSSVSSIIASSSNAKFRKTCYDSMRVTNTCEFRVSLQRSLQTVMDGRFAPRRMCTNEKMAEAVSSEQSSIEEDFENPPGFSPKRNDGDVGSSCSIPKKRRCSQFPETSDTFMNVMNSDVFEASDIQRRPLSPIQLPQSQQAKMTQDMPSVPSLTKLTKRKNKQVEKQWLQELENFSEWD
ncbi:hypothetical protein IRJ41_017660 [Triplophysa rosa]|uniref:Uncharacterized protein n=1 Tax=Triplophysa rosa TaxID=992332 RepID=A0A9W7WLC2_TRIRA|nr:hypothetical protein IRJ41_017660 [Triplophysa rosa]